MTLISLCDCISCINQVEQRTMLYAHTSFMSFGSRRCVHHGDLLTDWLNNYHTYQLQSTFLSTVPTDLRQINHIVVLSYYGYFFFELVTIMFGCDKIRTLIENVATIVSLR